MSKVEKLSAYLTLVQHLMALSEPGQEKCDCCPWEEEYPECTGCICNTTKEAAKAILDMQETIKKQRDLLMAFGGETGIRRLKEYADKYWELLQKTRWTPVTEALPEIDEHHCSKDVLVYLEDGGMTFSALEENCFGQAWFECERPRPDGADGYVVTHWFPLPEPPKEGNDSTSEVGP